MKEELLPMEFLDELASLMQFHSIKKSRMCEFRCMVNRHNRRNRVNTHSSGEIPVRVLHEAVKRAESPTLAIGERTFGFHVLSFGKYHSVCVRLCASTENALEACRFECDNMFGYDQYRIVQGYELLAHATIKDMGRYPLPTCAFSNNKCYFDGIEWHNDNRGTEGNA